MLCSLLNYWNYFWNKYCNLPFLAYCRSLLPVLIFLASSWYQKAKIGLWMSLQNKKIVNYYIKGLPTFLSFSFLIDCCISVLPLSLSKRLQIFGNWWDLIGKLSLYNNGENLKMLIEIFCQKLIVSNAILVSNAFLDHLKSKIFFVGQPWWPT